MYGNRWEMNDINKRTTNEKNQPLITVISLSPSSHWRFNYYFRFLFHYPLKKTQVLLLTWADNYLFMIKECFWPAYLWWFWKKEKNTKVFLFLDVINMDWWSLIWNAWYHSCCGFQLFFQVWEYFHKRSEISWGCDLGPTWNSFMFQIHLTCIAWK